MEKEPCTKFCGNLISFHEVIRLQSFEFDVSDITPANLQNILPLLHLFAFVNFVQKEPYTEFYSVSDHFTRSYEVLNNWTVSPHK